MKTSTANPFFLMRNSPLANAVGFVDVDKELLTVKVERREGNKIHYLVGF